MPDGFDAGATVRSDLHRVALSYAAAGVPIFPCVAGEKRPATEHGFQDASVDPETIAAWWTENPDYNVAIEPERAGWAVIDVDPQGITWATERIAAGELPATFTVQTPRGGRHFYYAGTLAPSASKLSPGVDTRGRGSYVLVPPSVTADGSYVVLDERDPVPLPAWISDALAAPKAHVVAATAVDEDKLDSPANLERARAVIARTPGAVEGAGSDVATYELAQRLMDHVTPATAIALAWAEWVPRCHGIWDQDWLAEKFTHAHRYRQNAIGSHAVPDFDPAIVAKALGKAPSGQNDATNSQGDTAGKFRGIKPSDGARRPKPTFWDKDKTLPRFPHGCRAIAAAPYGNHKTNLVLAKVLDAMRDHGARVLYIAGEASDDLLTQRIPAQCAVRGITIESLDDNLLVVETCPLLTDPDQTDALIEEHQRFRPDFVVIDTLSEAMTGKDENSAEVASLIMAEAGRIRVAFNCAVILVHHFGKDKAKGARGSSVFPSGADAVWEINFNKSTGIVTQHIDKVRGGRAQFDVLWGTTIVDEVMTVIPLTKDEAERAHRAETNAQQEAPAQQAQRAARAAVSEALMQMKAVDCASSVSRQELAERLAGDPKSYPNTHAWKTEVLKHVRWLDNHSRDRTPKQKGAVRKLPLLDGLSDMIAWPMDSGNEDLIRRWFLRLAGEAGEDQL